MFESRRWHTAKGKLLIAVCCLLFIEFAGGQDYHWPTDAGRILTSSFGEYRSGHFHAGIDFKTWGRIGYNVFAVDDGSIVRVRVSPYGYGRVVYLKLNNGMTVVYAHLLRFSEFIEKRIREEQKQRGRFTVDKSYAPGVLTVSRGDVLGYTGRSGTRDPHLHFEMRGEENQPFNPLFILEPIEDTIPPTVSGVAASPLSHASHVGGDFQQKVFTVSSQGKGKYVLDDAIRVWGEIGLSISAFDKNDGASNRFAPYRVRLFVDEELVFSVQYDSFAYNITNQVELDRDYRLKRRGRGLYQRLYRAAGNELPFYEPNSSDAGVLYCQDEIITTMAEDTNSTERFENGSKPVQLGSGDHALRIEVMDFYENVSEVRGVLRTVPLAELGIERINEEKPSKENKESSGNLSEIDLDIDFYEEYIRFGVRFQQTPRGIPTLYVGTNGWNRELILLYMKSIREYFGTVPCDDFVDGMLSAEVRFVDHNGEEKVIEDSRPIFRITPEEGGTVISFDGQCSVIFPRGSVYQQTLASCRPDTFFHSDGSLHRKYIITPQDVPLRRSVKVMMDVSVLGMEEEKTGIYVAGKNDNVSFAGNRWEDGTVSAWVGSLNDFTVLVDTMAPEINFIMPNPDAHIRDRSPRIAVGFEDAQSGVYGEDSYVVRLDGVRLIMEYDPAYDVAFHPIEDPLTDGKHVLDIMIKDQSGNITERQSIFLIDPAR